MGAKTCLVAQAQGDVRGILAERPDLLESETTGFVAALFPGLRFGAPRPADLTWTFVRDRSVIAGCFPGLRIVVAAEVAGDRPSQLPPRFISAHGTTLLHAMHSVVDWCAFAVWRDGVLIRSLSVSPEGVIEDIGERLPFEKPYWDGERPAVDPEEEAADAYPLPFHPLELGEHALLEFLGFQLGSVVDETMLDPASIRLLCFDDPGKVAAATRGARPWWKFW